MKQSMSRGLVILLATVVFATLAIVLFFFWRHVLFWSYWLGVVCFLALGIIHTMSAFGSGQGPSALAAQIAIVQATDTFFKRWRFRIILVVDVVAGALVWPASWISGIVLNRAMHRSRIVATPFALEAFKVLNPIHLQRSLFVVAFVILLLLTYLILPEPGLYRRILLFTIATHCVLMLVVYSSGPQSLPTHLRRSVVSPYLGFLAIAVALFASIVLACAGFRYWGTTNFVSFDNAASVALDMLRFRKIQQAFSGNALTVFDCYVACAGGLFYAVFLRSLLRFRDFVRTDEDHVAIAGSYLLLGRFTEALRSLRNVKSDNQNSLNVAGLAYLGVNQLEEAVSSAEKALAIGNVGVFRQGDEYALLADGSMTMAVPAHSLERLLDAWLNRGVSGIAFFSCATGYITQGRLHPNDVRTLVEKDGRHHSIPLTYALVRLFTDDEDDAKAQLDAMETTSAAQEMIRRILLMMWGLANEDRSILESTMHDHLGELGRLATQLDTDFERVFILSVLSGILDSIHVDAPEYEQELRYTVDTIQTGMSEGDLQRLMPLLIDRLRNVDSEDMPPDRPTTQMISSAAAADLPSVHAGQSAALAPKPRTPTPQDIGSDSDEQLENNEDRKMKDFFVSYNGNDKPWAEWIAWTLEEAGYSVVIQAWDFRPGDNFVLEMQKATRDCEKTIAVLSQNYLDALFTQPEWAAAFVDDPTGGDRKLVPVRIEKCDVEGLLKAIVYVDLVGIPEDDARLALLGAFSGRAKPETAPTFPGSPTSVPPTARVAPTQKAYPATTTATSSAPTILAVRSESGVTPHASHVAAQDRLAMIQQLNAIVPQQFNMLVYALNPPPGLIPPMPAAQADRAGALLKWVESPSGCGIDVVSDLLKTIVHPQ